MDQTGKLLQQRYRLKRQIGQGGMGAVYIAEDERFGSTVAIKQTLCMDDHFRRAIDREARLLNSLRHPALPRVSDHFVEDDVQYIVMEYVPGEDLCCILEERGTAFPFEQVLVWADELLDALDYLHNQSNPVIHRDIKPQNLKVMPNGRVVLLDFGLAKGNPTDAKNSTTAGKSIFGYTRSYASLEQIQGTGTDPRSDLYSLAATLYHLVTGVPPDDALTRAMAVLTHQPDPLRPAHFADADVPVVLSAVLHNALDLNASKRPASASVMRKMLREHENYSESEFSTPRAPSATLTLHDQRTRLFNEKTVAATGATGAAGGRISAPDSQPTVLRPAAKPAGGRRKFLWAAGGLGSLLAVAGLAGGILVYEDPGPDGPRGLVPEVPTSSAGSAEPALLPAVDGAPNVGTRAPVAPAPSVRAEQWPAEQASRPPGVTRADTRTQADQPITYEEDGERITIDGDSVTVGNTTVTRGRIVTPDGVFELNREGRTPLPPDVRIPPEALRQLTPLQRRKLREAIRRSANIAPPPAPAATPPPDQKPPSN